ncbi:MAG: hypothetical protein EA353_14835 [Puniceicoccaceae bacterium]|nr:MAG: hypothetical protein EA353_14835 [Puniceicoccaceae bacterium]
MKRIYQIMITSLSLFQLAGASQIYEGFNVDDAAADERRGFMTSWHRLAGEVGISRSGLSLPGLKPSSGALALTARGEALAQIEADVTGNYYGSFRVRSSRLSNDSIIGLLLAPPNLDELTPRSANVSILVKRWRDDFGAILSDGSAAQTSGGAAIRENETYLVLFKVQDGSAGQRLIESWVLNADQVGHFAENDFTEKALNAAKLGRDAGSVMQRTSLNPKRGTRLSLRRGDVVACIAKLNPATQFDEINITTTSLRDAAGLLEK